MCVKNRFVAIRFWHLHIEVLRYVIRPLYTLSVVRKIHIAQIPLHRLCNKLWDKFADTNHESPWHESRCRLSCFVSATLSGTCLGLCRGLCRRLSPCIVTDHIPLEWHKQVCCGLVTDFVANISTCRDFRDLCQRLSPKLNGFMFCRCLCLRLSLRGSFSESRRNGIWAYLAWGTSAGILVVSVFLFLN